MGKYRAKPVVIEAEQFLPPTGRELPRGVEGVPSPNADNWNYMGCIFWVTTIHGDRATLEFYDYIVPEPDGIHYYPVKREIFEAKYEPVGDA